jgi:hypothetical protein
VYTRDGEQIHHSPKTLETRKAAYVEQLIYTNGQVLATLDRIIAADPGAVIVVQSDEGPHPGYWGQSLTDWTKATDDQLEVKFKILNAYRFPGVDTSSIPATISPVNTFRFVLDAYLGADLPLLPDRSFVSGKRTPYRFVSVDDRIDP